jgi:hypothetical protein
MLDQAESILARLHPEPVLRNWLTPGVPATNVALAQNGNDQEREGTTSPRQAITVQADRPVFYLDDPGAPTRIQEAAGNAQKTWSFAVGHRVPRCDCLLPAAQSVLGDGTVRLTRSGAIDAEDVAKMSDHNVLGHIQPDDAPEHAQSEKPKIERDAGDQAEHTRDGHL